MADIAPRVIIVQQGSAQPPAAPATPAEAADPVQAESPIAGKIIINGKEVPLDGTPGDVATATGFPLPPDIPTNVYKLAETGIVAFALMIAAFPVFGFAKALVTRRANAQAALPPREMTDRLARIEAAVDAMSVEVERISEGQRFVTRVLAERSSAGT